jgi:hypothetical protein
VNWIEIAQVKASGGLGFIIDVDLQVVMLLVLLLLHDFYTCYKNTVK